jgi:hypothetical protein
MPVNGHGRAILSEEQRVVVARIRTGCSIPQPLFAEAMLATFLGPAPASERLKRKLLEGHG